MRHDPRIGWLLACDPGAPKKGKGCGLAAFHNGVLYSCAVAESIGKPRDYRPFERVARLWVPEKMIREYDHYAGEAPQYRGENAKNTPDQLFPLAALMMRMHCLAGSPTSSQFPTPGEWKSNKNKEKQNDRDFRVLSAEEKLIAKPFYGKSDHVLDAIGIGLWAVFRGVK